MSPIKTVQPYKLYKKFVDAKKSVKRGIIAAIGLIIIMGIIDPTTWLITGILIILAFPILFYNPFLKAQYEPGKSYSWVKDSATLKAPEFLTKGLPIIGFALGLVIDIIEAMFPVCTLIMGISFSAIAYFTKKHPEKMLMWKDGRKRLSNHQNVDYNVKVDLKDIYGIDDKMVLSYQNFHFNQKHLEKGDYLLGVSPLGVYFANKSDSVCKSFIKFEDIDTLGLLATFGNKFIFNIKSKSNVEINIIIDEDDSLVVSPYKIFDTLLDTLDSFIINGGIASAPTARRRRVTLSPTSQSSSINNTEVSSSVSGRSVELEMPEAKIDEKQETTNNRVVDILFTDTVIAELTAGELVTSNRNIEL